MATARRTSSRRRGRARALPPKPAVKKRAPKPKPEINIAELRKQLGEFKKEVIVVIPQTALTGSLAQIAEKIKAYAKLNNLPAGYVVDRRSVQLNSRHTYRNSETKWVLVGLRPYTDSELKKEGARLLKQKEAREAKEKKARERDLAKFNELASKLGVEPVKVKHG